MPQLIVTLDHIHVTYVRIYLLIYLHTHNCLKALCPGLPRWASTRRNIHTLTPSWSSDILYQLSPFTMIHSILLVQFMCLTVLFHNLSPGPLWSSSWSGTLYFILHTFLHPSYFFHNTCPYHRSLFCLLTYLIEYNRSSIWCFSHTVYYTSGTVAQLMCMVNVFFKVERTAAFTHAA